MRGAVSCVRPGVWLAIFLEQVKLARISVLWFHRVVVARFLGFSLGAPRRGFFNPPRGAIEKDPARRYPRRTLPGNCGSANENPANLSLSLEHGHRAGPVRANDFPGPITASPQRTEFQRRASRAVTTSAYARPRPRWRTPPVQTQTDRPPRSFRVFPRPERPRRASPHHGIEPVPGNAILRQSMSQQSRERFSMGASRVAQPDGIAVCSPLQCRRRRGKQQTTSMNSPDNGDRLVRVNQQG